MYSLFWKLRPSGVLSLNLDRFAQRAFSAIAPGAALTEFVGRTAGEFGHVLQAAQTPFVASLHGIVDQVSSWVFTSNDLSGLISNPGYKTFVSSCLASRVVVFVAISAEDVAAGGHLQRLREDGVRLGDHFWITARGDAETDAWAEKAGIQTIRYRVQDTDHRELTEAINDLLSYVPADTIPPPVIPQQVDRASDAIPPARELIALPAEDIRFFLSDHATSLLRRPSPDGENDFAAFCREYEQAIYRAWYVSDQPPDNQFFGYRILSHAERGSFGRVFKAEAEDGQVVALKLLHEEVRTRLTLPAPLSSSLLSRISSRNCKSAQVSGASRAPRRRPAGSPRPHLALTPLGSGGGAEVATCAQSTTRPEDGGPARSPSWCL